MKNPTILTFSDKFQGKAMKTTIHRTTSFLKQRTKTDLSCVKQLVAFVNERGNPIDGRKILIKNLVTGAIFNKKSSPFNLNCFSERNVAYEKFRKERLEIKSTKLFDTIPKCRSSFKKGKPRKAPDINEDTVNFLRTVDYARLRGVDVEYLLTHEIVATSYYLTKGGEFRKYSKSEYARELKNLLEQPCPTNVPETTFKTAIVIDFMAYARKVPINKMNLVCYEDLFGALWKTFSSLSKGCTRIDIVSDLNLQQSIKQGERIQKGKLEPI